LEQANGEYIAVLDADDIALKERLQMQVDLLDRNQDFQLVGSAYEIIDAKGETKCIQRVTENPSLIRLNLLFGNCIAHSTTMFRRTVALQLGGYDPELSCGEDFDLWVRLAAYGRIVLLDEVLVKLRPHCASLTSKESIEVKRIAAQAICNSVRLQTNQYVEPDVAAALHRDYPARAANRKAVFTAYETVERTLERFRTDLQMNRQDRQRVTYFALEDIFRIARHNSGSYGYAWRVALNYADAPKMSVISSTRFVKMVLKALLLGFVIDPLRKLVAGISQVEDSKMKV
jgi:hypothetical protein